MTSLTIVMAWFWFRDRGRLTGGNSTLFTWQCLFHGRTSRLGSRRRCFFHINGIWKNIQISLLLKSKKHRSSLNCRNLFRNKTTISKNFCLLIMCIVATTKLLAWLAKYLWKWKVTLPSESLGGFLFSSTRSSV